MPETTLPTALPNVITGLLIVGGLSVLALLILAKLPKTDEAQDDPVRRLMKQFGVDGLPRFVFIVAAILWLGIFGLLTTGLFGLIWEVLSEMPPHRDDGTGVWNWRFKLVQLTALTTVLGAVVVLPVTLQRLRLSREQTETAKAALFNEKITEAAADLHAQRQVSQKVGASKWEPLWEDDIVRRNAAIDRLEGLVREEPYEAERVCRLLSVYVRELSSAFFAKGPPEATRRGAIEDWAHALRIPRTDMQNAVQVLGRLSNVRGVDKSSLAINLSETNLQGMNLRNLDFSHAVLSGASMHGADLRDAKFREAQLNGANLQGADLEFTNFHNANLEKADFREANLNRVYFVGANLKNANLDGGRLSDSDFREADLAGATMEAASPVAANFRNAKLDRVRLQYADISNADMTGASLNQISLYGANLGAAILRDANLNSADLRKAFLGDADITGADLSAAKISSETLLDGVIVLGACVRHMNLAEAPQGLVHINQLFGDGTVTLPNGTPWPRHWPREQLEWRDFDRQWRDWAATKGIRISENPYF